MTKRCCFIAALLLCFAARVAVGQEQSLVVQICVAQNAVRANERFSVTTMIRNTGTRERTLLVWERSFPAEWLVDNPDVCYVDQLNCQQDTKTTIKLQPGKVYIGSLSVYIQLSPNSINQKKVNFRLGFGNRVFSRNQMQPEASAIWSNVVPVVVTGKGAN